MYASVLTFQVQPGQRDEFVRLAEELATPKVKPFKGLQRAYAMTDPTTDKGMLVGVYETEADARAAETSDLYRQLVARYILPFSVPESLERHVYEVNIQAVLDEAREMGV